MGTLDVLDIDVALRQPVPQLSQFPSIRKERVLGKPFLDGEIVEIHREMRREEGRVIRWPLHAPPYRPCTTIARTVRKRRRGSRGPRRSADTPRTRAGERTRRRRASRASVEGTGQS